MSDATTAAATGDATQQAASTATAAANTAAQGAATATQQQPASTTGAEGAAGGEQKPADDASTQVPETYDLKAPDGLELETTALTEFTAIAKELKLSNENAQKLANIATAMEQRRAEAHVKMVKDWAEQSKADKDIGGDSFDGNMASARKFLDTFGSPELRELLDTSGFGNHPAVVRAFVKAGKAFGEDGFVASGTRAATPAQSFAKALYPNMN